MAPKASSKAAARKADAKKVFAGLTFCVSGAFAVSQGEMKKQLERHGGKMASTVNAGVDYLICNEEGSTKYQAAEEKGKPVVSEEWVVASIDSGQLSTDPAHFIFNPDGDAEGEGEGEGNGEGEGGEGEDEMCFKGCVFMLDTPEDEASKQEFYFSHGAKVVDTFTSKVTHVIAYRFGSELTKRAKAAGVPVVHGEWVAECLTEGALLDPDDFVPAPEGGDEEGQGEDDGGDGGDGGGEGDGGDGGDKADGGDGGGGGDEADDGNGGGGGDKEGKAGEGGGAAADAASEAPASKKRRVA